MVEQKNIRVFNSCYNTLASLAYISTLLRKFVPLVLLLVFHTEGFFAEVIVSYLYISFTYVSYL